MSREDTTKKLWNKLGNLYQSKSLVNKLFLQKKLYLMRMRGDDLVIEHLNTFNTVINHLLSIDIKIPEEEKSISLLCSFPDSWDNLLVDIGRNNTTLKLNDVVATLLSEEMK